MLSRLTRTRRTTAGRLLALTYVFGVLASAMSFAFADGARAAPCPTENEHGIGIVHVHEHGAVAQHVHEDGRSHDHSSLAVASAPDDVAAAAVDPDSLPLDHHKSSGGECCGMACVSALPATMTEVVRPTAPRSICLPTEYRAVADNAPPQLYRPPIA